MLIRRQVYLLDFRQSTLLDVECRRRGTRRRSRNLSTSGTSRTDGLWSRSMILFYLIKNTVSTSSSIWACPRTLVLSTLHTCLSRTIYESIISEYINQHTLLISGAILPISPLGITSISSRFHYVSGNYYLLVLIHTGISRPTRTQTLQLGEVTTAERFRRTLFWNHAPAVANILGLIGQYSILDFSAPYIDFLPRIDRRVFIVECKRSLPNLYTY
jgi:hypothetical protein